ncbi:MAG: sigma-70 family RNA polymerase sigma factor [Planctomycetes bacterium]|nr:sigma-70 family RNA polymerase sigma factor [Planctomycetota bacterium]
MSDDDEKLVESVLAGDRKAFDVLVERYQRQSVAVAARMLGNIDDAMEAAQEGFIRAYQALGQLKNPARFGPWLMKIMANQALNARRSRRRNPKVSLSQSFGSDPDSDGPLPVASDDPSVTEKLAAGELAVALQKAIAELPENLRTPLLLFSVEKLPQKEIAEIMKCSLQTVKWSVFEARRQLRKKLKKMLD